MTNTYVAVTAGTVFSVGVSCYLALSGQTGAAELSFLFSIPSVLAWEFFTALEFKD